MSYEKPPRADRARLNDDSVRLTNMSSELSANHVTPDVTPIGLLRIDHVGVAVHDLDEAIAFYQDTFGMTCVHVEENQEQGVREAMMRVGPSLDGGCVQLLAPLRPESPIAKFLDR